MEIKRTRFSGSVIIVRLKRKWKKVAIKNKNELRGTNIFIENDLSFEGKNKQMKIRTFVTEKRRLGWNIKAGEESIFLKGDTGDRKKKKC